ncbi:DUF3140 domain-containing protein [Falsirhodobacter sp. 20TX0035]|uniref:DUF3140 domain-containing protein n=1 Tax=Falsirhodobacter sp. 20TX0035 TaxID=3022019 RepID=UPI00232BA987|nr:DUF3140 domain-containing protein [Falsirhodobacter sp. 20TX0035]MDB6452120.1 DUF3140 domain-containing protein [Falsirhodobacter sp. 20TX0035]
MTKSHDDIWDEWSKLVNMTPAALKRWLDTEESRSVGDTRGEGESTGHQSGRHILKIQDTKKADLSDDDWAHMGKVVGYIKRHKAQGGPQSDMEHSDWRYSLMNWGHDPMK